MCEISESQYFNIVRDFMEEDNADFDFAVELADKYMEAEGHVCPSLLPS